MKKKTKLKYIENTRAKCQTAAGQALRDYRKKLGLPAGAVCGLANIAHDSWCHVETGTNTVRAGELLAILVDIESTPGRLEQIKAEYAAKDKTIPAKKADGQVSLKDAFADINAASVILDSHSARLDRLEKRLFDLEIGLGVDNGKN